MTDRIDTYLKGNLDRGQLTADERARADVAARVIHEAHAFVNARPIPDVASRVMRQIADLDPATEPVSWFRRFVAALWTGRRVSFQFRPAYGLVGLAVVAILILRPSPSRPVERAFTPNAAAPQLFVQFRLQATDASTVRLAGSFTNWQPVYELRRTAPGVWTITVPLSPGVHDYAFVVDGDRWVPDPLAQLVDDGFGGVNSRLALLAPEASRL